MTASLNGPCFFEIPVYRCPREVYAREKEAGKRAYMAYAELHKGTAPEAYRRIEMYFESEVWYPWGYNEAIGWIRLCGGGCEMRGDLYFVRAKRIVRRGRKRFEWLGKVLELRFNQDYSSEEILQETVSELERVGKQRQLRRRHIDLQAFKQIGPFVDWRRLLGLEG